MAITWQAVDSIEPIADTTIEAIANIGTYNVISGCGATYNAGSMDVTIAAGSITHNGTVTTVAGNSVTLVSDPSSPRWTWIGINSSGVASIVSGDPATTPTVPEIGDLVTAQLVYVQANLTIANNASYKIDKRVISPPKPQYKALTGTKVFTADTTFANVSDGTNTLSAPVAAGQAVMVTWNLGVTFGGTGGLKLQLTGPAAPTTVFAYAEFPVTSLATAARTSAATSFSSSIMSRDSNTQMVAGVVTVTAYILNGSTAGTVTLQAAQDNANSTTTIAVGSQMVVETLAAA